MHYESGEFTPLIGSIIGDDVWCYIQVSYDGCQRRVWINHMPDWLHLSMAIINMNVNSYKTKLLERF